MRSVIRTTLMLLLAGFAATVPAQDKTVISEVRFVGLERLDAATVQYYSSLEAGDLYSEEEARKDFLKIWEIGFFENMWLETEETLDGVVLTDRYVVGH